MDCNNPDDIEKSEKLFRAAETYKDFLELWSRFYLNKICIPTYLDNFVGAEDNPDATLEVGSKFREIVQKGVIPVDYQPGSPEGQKAYVIMFVPSDLARVLSIYINRYPGYVSFNQDFESGSLTDLYVTYDCSEQEEKNSVKKGVFFGEPHTHLGDPDKDALEFIREWLSHELEFFIDPYNFVSLTVIDTIPSRKNTILDIILNALRDNSALVTKIVSK